MTNNDWSKYHMVNGRTFDDLKRRLAREVNVPCKIVQWGVAPSGAPFVILSLDRPATSNIKAPDIETKTIKADA